MVRPSDTEPPSNVAATVTRHPVILGSLRVAFALGASGPVWLTAFRCHPRREPATVANEALSGPLVPRRACDGPPSLRPMAQAGAAVQQSQSARSIACRSGHPNGFELRRHDQLEVVLRQLSAGSPKVVGAEPSEH